MVKKPAPIIIEVETGQWMATFSDLLTLLLAFFVLLLTMSSMDDRSFKEAFGLFNGAFGTLAKQKEAGMAPDFIVPVSAPIPEILVSDMEEILDRHMREKAEEGKAPPEVPPEPEQYRELFETEATDDGVEVRIAGDVLFEPRSAELQPRSRALLKLVAEDVAMRHVPVRVKSYVPPARADRDGAWDLSLERASVVTGIIASVRGVDPSLVSLMGYGRRAPRTLRVDPDGSVVVLTFFTEDTDKRDLKELGDTLDRPTRLDELAPDRDVPLNELGLPPHPKDSETRENTDDSQSEEDHGG